MAIRGRKPIGKQAMTPAERQKRHRDRVRQEKAKLAKEIAKAEKRAKNEARLAEHQRRQAPLIARMREEWARTPPAQPLATAKEELAQQVLDALKIEGIALEAFQEALNRRAGRI